MDMLVVQRQTNGWWTKFARLYMILKSKRYARDRENTIRKRECERRREEEIEREHVDTAWRRTSFLCKLGYPKTWQTIDFLYYINVNGDGKRGGVNSDALLWCLTLWETIKSIRYNSIEVTESHIGILYANMIFCQKKNINHVWNLAKIPIGVL